MIGKSHAIRVARPANNKRKAHLTAKKAAAAADRDQKKADKKELGKARKLKLRELKKHKKDTATA